MTSIPSNTTHYDRLANIEARVNYFRQGSGKEPIRISCPDYCWDSAHAAAGGFPSIGGVKQEEITKWVEDCKISCEYGRERAEQSRK